MKHQETIDYWIGATAAHETTIAKLKQRIRSWEVHQNTEHKRAKGVASSDWFASDVSGKVCPWRTV